MKKESIHQIIKDKFIEGGPGFMGIVLLCLILGLALAIERIIYLNMATTNTDKLLVSVEDALNKGGVEAAQEVCRNTKGPVASIFYQGLERSDEGIEMVEKSIISYGSVQMGLLEKGLSWISLFIALAPMLGFMGTVIGMIDAFDKIAQENNISPDIVAGGIKIALLTTVFGLIVAMILQVFYNYLIAKVDAIVNSMEDASISLVDLLAKNKNRNMIFKDILKYLIISVAVLLMGLILNKGEEKIEMYTTFLREANITTTEWEEIKKDDAKKNAVISNAIMKENDQFLTMSNKDKNAKIEDYEESLKESLENQNNYIKPFILLGVFLSISGLLLALIFSAVKLFSDKKNAKKTIFMIGGLVSICAVSYALASDTTSVTSVEVSNSAVKQVGMGLITFYILIASAIIAIIYSEISKLTSK